MNYAEYSGDWNGEVPRGKVLLSSLLLQIMVWLSEFESGN